MTFILIAFVLFQKMNESSKVETEVKNIATLRTNLKSLYYGKNLVAEQELNNVLINADLVPESMLNGDKETIINAWGSGLIKLVRTVEMSSRNILYKNRSSFIIFAI